MTKGRKVTSTVIETAPAINGDLVSEDIRAVEVLASQGIAARQNAVALAGTLGYEGSLNPDILEAGIQSNQQRVQFEMFEAGKRLLLLREQCEHGDFQARLERLAIEPRAAQKFMQATLKFANAPSTAHLANYGKTKLLELLVLDDAEVATLTDGGSARGITLDDIDCMSVSELRRALRVAAAEQAAALADKDAVIVQKTAKIEELVEAKNRREGMTDAENHAELERALSEATLGAVGAMQVIRYRIQDIRALDNLPQGLYVGCANALQRIVSEAMGIADDYGIELTLAAELPDDGAMLDDPNAGETFDPAE